jgi:hypothetical protein
MDERIGLMTVDLSAHASDIYINNVGRGVKMEIPYFLEQHGAGDNLTFLADQILQNLEFSRKQLNRSAAAARRS